MDGWSRSAVVKISVLQDGRGAPFAIKGVNLPPLVSMPTEYGNVPAPLPGGCGGPPRFQRFQMPMYVLEGD
jgi:hypothetical protein